MKAFWRIPGTILLSVPIVSIILAIYISYESSVSKDKSPRIPNANSSKIAVRSIDTSGYSEVPRRRLPNALIVGCPKCGTRALIWFLSLHPDVKAVYPEVHFFDKEENYEKGIDWYRSLFPPRLENQIGIERSPSYFTAESVPKRIFDMDSSTKIIVTVCEPVRRTISQFAQLSGYDESKYKQMFINRFGQHSKTSDDVSSDKAGPMDGGLYYDHTQRWMQWFPLRQIHFVDGDGLRVYPFHQIRLVEDFLDIPHKVDEKSAAVNKTSGFYCAVKDNGETPKCLEKRKGLPRPKTDPELKQKMADFYRQSNQRFMETIGKQFDWGLWD